MQTMLYKMQSYILCSYHRISELVWVPLRSCWILGSFWLAVVERDSMKIQSAVQVQSRTARSQAVNTLQRQNQDGQSLGVPGSLSKSCLQEIQLVQCVSVPGIVGQHTATKGGVPKWGSLCDKLKPCPEPPFVSHVILSGGCCFGNI